MDGDSSGFEIAISIKPRAVDLVWVVDTRNDLACIVPSRLMLIKPVRSLKGADENSNVPGTSRSIRRDVTCVRPVTRVEGVFLLATGPRDTSPCNAYGVVIRREECIRHCLLSVHISCAGRVALVTVT